jgi:hypothetical protein
MADPVSVCGECGMDVEHVSAALQEKDRRIAVLEEQVDVLKEDVRNAEGELRGKRAQIKRMKVQQDAALRASDHFEAAMDVLEKWRELCSPNARELGGKRLANVIDRLRGGYTASELKESVWGYSLKPYVVDGKRSHTGSPDDWYADAELIFRDATKVDAGLAIAKHARQLQRAGAAIGNQAPPTTDGTLSDLGETAVRLARHGFFVFPCRPREKAPATPNGLKDAKRDEAAIRAAWGKHPDLNLAVRTGKESGIVVLDVDGDDGFDSLASLEEQHGKLPRTASVTTPRGGQHFYFAHPGVEIKNTAGYPGMGLDVRGDGGYVLAPPSVGPTGARYEPDEEAPLAPMPEWLVKTLTSSQGRSQGRLSADDRAKLIGAGAPQGERNSRMASHVGWLLSRVESVEAVRELAHTWNEARLKPPLSAKEVDAVVDSIARKDGR